MKIFKLLKYTDIIRGINKPLNQFEISIFFDICIILGLPPELWSSTINGNIDDSSFLPSYQQSKRSLSSVCLVWPSIDPLCPSYGYQICQMFTNPFNSLRLEVLGSFLSSVVLMFLYLSCQQRLRYWIHYHNQYTVSPITINKIEGT